MVIRVKNVSVCYMVGDFREIGFKDYLLQKVTRKYDVKEFYAVKNVSFTLERGDFLGIIGTNGAGKSTLLKSISGVLKPTAGTIRVNGNISALLELGTGFDGDMTLKENVYLRGALLGYQKEFLNKTYEDIISFSELKEFENRKFKQLSSGMKARLAFSIASLIEPDILIIDEALSVGDGAFREKSEKKMMEILERGATTLFVSHSLAQIRRLCNKVLWLDHGQQVAFGEAKAVCDEYEKYITYLREQK